MAMLTLPDPDLATPLKTLLVVPGVFLQPSRGLFRGPTRLCVSDTIPKGVELPLDRDAVAISPEDYDIFRRRAHELASLTRGVPIAVDDVAADWLAEQGLVKFERWSMPGGTLETSTRRFSVTPMGQAALAILAQPRVTS